MDEGTQKGKKVATHEKDWDAYFSKQHTWFTEHIGALKQTEADEAAGTQPVLAPRWTRDLYEMGREYLEMFNEINKKMDQLSKSITTLETRLALAESELSQQAKQRRIQGL